MYEQDMTIIQQLATVLFIFGVCYLRSQLPKKFINNKKS